MKKLILIIFSVCFSLFFAKAESNLMFEKANQLYHNKMYDSASSLYMQMINDGYENADIYYNAGNSFYRSEKNGMAIWCFKKALQLKRNINIEDNLALAQKKIKEPIYKNKDIFFIQWWKAIYNIFSINIWAVLGLLFFLFSMLFLILQKIKSKRFISKAFIRVGFLLSFLCLFFMYVKWNQDTYHYKGIIVSEALNLTERKISEGIEAEYAGVGKTGINVILPNGKIVNISNNCFRKL